jgi:hypothetical protein
MNFALFRFATRFPTVCAVCRRRAVWLGYAPLGNFQSLQRDYPIVWLCKDNGCHRAAKRFYHMEASHLDVLERAAVLEAGTDAGSYLEELGATDMAQLTKDQWLEFLRRVVTGFEKKLRSKIVEEVKTAEEAKARMERTMRESIMRANGAVS